MKNNNNNKNISYGIEYFQHDEVTLALHAWIPATIHSVLFYIHGIQSHGGWSYETGPDLAAKGIAFYILDRRGSGVSTGLRGDIPSAKILLNDYLFILTELKKRHSEHALVLMGHSLGGSILAGLIAWPQFSITYDAAIFCASALGKLHSTLSMDEQTALLQNTRTTPYSIHLNDLDYTTDPIYLDFIKNDPYCCRVITERSRAALLEIEKLYWKKNIISNAPALYIYPKEDPLVDLPAAHNIYMEMTAGKGFLFQIPANLHYMWFSEYRFQLANCVSHFVLSNGYSL